MEITLHDYWIPYLVSNLIAVLLVIICFKWHKIGKIVFGILFFSAGIFNIYTSINSPEVYVEVYGSSAVLPFYKEIIFGIFSLHTTLFVVLIASGQITVSVLLFTKKIFFKIGIIGGIIFLVAIAPLGIGSAFPATIIMAMALYFFYKRSTAC